MGVSRHVGGELVRVGSPARDPARASGEARAGAALAAGQGRRFSFVGSSTRAERHEEPAGSR
jgi:hypothetical protein